MECDVCRSKLLEYLDGDLTEGMQAELGAHLGRCGSCRDEVQALQETLALIAWMPVPEPPEAFWQQYLREIRQRAAPTRPANRLRNWLATLSLRPIPALAAAITIVLAVLLTWSSIHERPTIPELASLDLTQQLMLSQDLDVLREMDLLEEIELFEDWDLIRARAIQGPPRAA